MPVNILSIGTSGIRAAEAEVAAIESNIANASNPNYSVESVGLSASANALGAGTGVYVLQTERAQAPFLTPEINGTQSTQSYSQAFSQVATLAQQLVSPASGSDLSQALQNLFNSFTNLSASPQDSTARQVVINAAASFAQTAQNVSSGLQTVAANALSQLPTLVDQVNTLTRQIAQLNGQILSAQAQGGSAGALMDQRDGLVNQLAGLIGASADSNGNVTVGGLPLVSGGTALTLSTTGSGASTALQVDLPKGSLQIPANQVGGTIGGMLAGAASVTSLLGQINDFATSVAGSLNKLHQGGYGLDGSTGKPLFLIPGGDGPIAINPAINVQNLAASSTAAGVPGDGSNAAAMAALANQQGLDSGYPNMTFGQVFAQITSGFGALVQQTNSDQQQAAASLQSLTAAKSSITGVSLNDQLAHLVQYQNQLQAAGRAVQAANDMTTYLLQEISQ